MPEGFYLDLAGDSAGERGVLAVAVITVKELADTAAR